MSGTAQARRRIDEHDGRLDLTDLGLSADEIAGLLEEMRRPGLVHSLDLSGNDLDPLPDALARLTGLRGLTARRGRMVEVPRLVTRLTSVRMLDVSDNHLVSLPAWLGEMEHLQYLVARNNGLRTVSAGLGRAGRLLRLELGANQLTDLPDELAALTALEHLDLTGNGLTYAPPVVFRMTGLRELRLGDNELSDLPAALGNLRGLRALRLENNRLDVLPAVLGLLTELEVLTLMDNRFQVRPAELDALPPGARVMTAGNPFEQEEPPRDDSPRPDWADPAGAVVVHAVYFQYYVYDPEAPQREDWPALHDSGGDGLLAPSRSAIRAVGAVHSGNIHLHVRVASHLPEPTGVAAATDLELPSGVLWVTGWEGGPVWQHDFGAPVRIRLLLEVTGRDELEEGRPPEEVQRMTVVVVDRPRPRWRSELTDGIGESLRSVRDTARAWDPGREP